MLIPPVYSDRSAQSKTCALLLCQKLHDKSLMVAFKLTFFGEIIPVGERNYVENLSK